MISNSRSRKTWLGKSDKARKLMLFSLKSVAFDLYSTSRCSQFAELLPGIGGVNASEIDQHPGKSNVPD